MENNNTLINEAKEIGAAWGEQEVEAYRDQHEDARRSRSLGECTIIVHVT